MPEDEKVTPDPKDDSKDDPKVDPKKSDDGTEDGKSTDADSTPSVDPLAVGRKFKQVGDFVVDAKFDPTKTAAFQDLNNVHVRLVQNAKDKESELTKTIGELKKSLESKSDVDDDLRKELQTKIAHAEQLAKESKTQAEAAGFEALRLRMIGEGGLPHQYGKYVTGTNEEEIKASVESVLVDFNLKEATFSKEDLEKARTDTKLETEKAMKDRGKANDGNADPHAFTREEINAMSDEEYAKSRNEILSQEKDGKIK